MFRHLRFKTAQTSKSHVPKHVQMRFSIFQNVLVFMSPIHSRSFISWFSTYLQNNCYVSMHPGLHSHMSGVIVAYVQNEIPICHIMYVYVSLCIYIYIERERERDSPL
jgi:hypothetical protein